MTDDLLVDRSATDGVPSLVVDVWADLVCPWCYIGHTRLRRAVADWHHPASVVVRGHAYELDPSAPRGAGVPVATMLAQKFGGGAEGARAMTAQVTAVAAEDGLTLDFDRAVAANSFDGHRLVALALDTGGPALQDAVLERLFSAHFAEGLVIDDHTTLARLAAEAGLDERLVGETLVGDDRAEAVRADEQAARELGVSGVPFVVAGGRVAVSGAQSPEVFGQLLDAGVAPRA